MATCVRKRFYPKMLKWQKVSHQDKKIEKVQICQNAPRPIKKNHLRAVNRILIIYNEILLFNPERESEFLKMQKMCVNQMMMQHDLELFFRFVFYKCDYCHGTS